MALSPAPCPPPPCPPPGAGKGGVGVSSLSLSLEKLLDQAQTSGELKLCGRNLKSFPRRQTSSAFFLRDTVSADLSRNKLNEVPDECIQFASMEKFLLYHNTIKSIPDSIIQLHSLQFLDLSRNQLSYLPSNLCMLPLQGLIVNNNRLVSLPEEIGKMQTLMELDASCNEIAHLPVQIGDLSSLKCLKLRRNHLQEIPVEISYLQLSTLDLSGNRISVLPVELRFMTTVIDLNLEENPLTCPPANLCSRGRIHIYKYLEIQAIKEDRRRGVLTDSEYRRSYRKTGSTQLSDLGFNNMFHCDPRRKRNTADSGYGSEQPLERRWSQDFNQEMMPDYAPHPEEGKRLILKAAVAGCGRPSDKKVVPLQAGSGSSTSSSGYNSLSAPWENGDHQEHKQPQTSHINPPQGSSPFTKLMDGLAISSSQDKKMAAGDFVDSPTQESSKVLLYNQNSSGKHQGVEVPSCLPPSSSISARPAANPPPTISKLPSPRYMPPSPAAALTSQPRYMMMAPKQTSGSSGLPLPSKMAPRGGTDLLAQGHSKVHSQTYRQYKEQLRQQRNNNSVGDPRNGSEPLGDPEERLTGDVVLKSRISSFHHALKQPSAKTTNGGGTNNSNINNSFCPPYSYDVKTMQKEALLSFVKSKASSSKLVPPSSSSSIPSLSSRRLHSNSGAEPPVRTFAARREAEKSASSEAHIQQLKLHLENRLRLTLPDDISGSLVDGVILCHMANHVKPRSVPSIHVPSPAVPKLTSAKCRKNVENFLLACRKIGVRDEDLFDWDNVVSLPDTERILHTLLALEERLYSPSNYNSSSDTIKHLDGDPSCAVTPHVYPDLVPLEETTNIMRLAAAANSQAAASTTPTPTNTTTTTSPAECHYKNVFESLFLSLLLIGTMSLLYAYPPNNNDAY